MPKLKKLLVEPEVFDDDDNIREARREILLILRNLCIQTSFESENTEDKLQGNADNLIPSASGPSEKAIEVLKKFEFDKLL